MRNITAAILAGGYLTTPDGQKVLTSSVEIKPHSSLCHVVPNALREVVATPIFMLGPVTENIPGVVVCPGASTPMQAVRAALPTLLSGKPEYLLVATVDLPFLCEMAVRDFLRKAIAANTDVAYAVAGYRECQKKYPGMKRTPFPSSTGLLTGGNLFLARASVVERLLDLGELLFTYRKKPHLIMLEVAKALLQGRAASFRLIRSLPSTAADVDSYEHLLQVRELLAP